MNCLEGPCNREHQSSGKGRIVHTRLGLFVGDKKAAYLRFSIAKLPTCLLGFAKLENRDVTRTLIGGGGGVVYSYIHVLPDEFLFKSNSNFSV